MPNPELFDGAESLNESHSVNVNLERQSDRRSSCFHSSRNAIYVCANPAPVAQPDRATDF